MSNQQSNRQQRQARLVPDQGYKAKTDPKEKYRVFIIVFVLLANIINTLFYNTGFLSFEKTDWDIIWSTGLVCFSVWAISFALLLGKEKLD